MERSNQDTYQPFPSVEGIPVYPRVADEPADPQFPVTPDSFPQAPSGIPGESAGTVTQENDFYADGETQWQFPPRERTGTGSGEQTTPAPVVINIPRPESVMPLIPSETPPGTPAVQSETRTVLPPAKPAAVPAVKQPVSAKPVPVPVKPAATAKPAAAPARETYDAYWVQAGSFSSRTNADSAKEILISKGITSIIENRELDGKTFYRVRIGPYISQNEANYWLALIQTMDGFGESLIWKNQVQRLN
jgi:DedD protein